MVVENVLQLTDLSLQRTNLQQEFVVSMVK